MFDFINKKWFYFIFSALIIVPGIISLILYGVKPSIDFTGGTLLELKISNQEPALTIDKIRKTGELQKIEINSIQQSGPDTYLIRLKPINKDQNQKLQEELGKELGKVTEIRFETVGPSIGKETTRNAIKAVIIASVAIILYIAFAFRQVPKPYSSFRFGICAVLALLHDVLVMSGLFSIFGHFLKVEIDTLFITALLTIMGFSVHDTIVVFDRIRENLKRLSGKPFPTIVNESIVQTLIRSISTSLTVLMTLFALLLFGGETIRWFVIALFIGIISGTYSSIFNAAPLLVVWEEWIEKKRVKSS